MKSPKETREMEGRSQPKKNPNQIAEVRTQSRGTLPLNLIRVNEAARKEKKTRFTALLHHVDVAALMRAFKRQKRGASAGVDGMTVVEYEKGLEERLKSLWERLQAGRYRPLPVRRSYIPKSDGSKRPLGIPALEDKIVQGAVAEVLSAIYEIDFLGFSYGFRPDRSPHHALRALGMALFTQRVNWVLDADIRRFFDSVDHEWMMRMLAHRIADRRVLRLINQWLKAGIWESGKRIETAEGTPQGAGISPLLANIFLHYVLDLWVQAWRKKQARGRVIVVRYADDFVMGFEYEEDGRKMLTHLKERLGKFGLALHEGKTRLIEFGRHAAENRARRGERKPETFSYLGLTHYCGKARKSGRFMIGLKTQGRRMAHKLKGLRLEVRRRMHDGISVQHEWLSSVLRGHYRYYGVPGNFASMKVFLNEVKRIWLRSLRRRSQKRPMSWKRFLEMLRKYPLPTPHIMPLPRLGFV
jgi:group II intron reverse transcriptase/maturase